MVRRAAPKQRTFFAHQRRHFSEDAHPEEGEIEQDGGRSNHRTVLKVERVCETFHVYGEHGFFPEPASTFWTTITVVCAVVEVDMGNRMLGYVTLYSSVRGASADV